MHSFKQIKSRQSSASSVASSVSRVIAGFSFDGCRSLVHGKVWYEISESTCIFCAMAYIELVTLHLHLYCTSLAHKTILLKKYLKTSTQKI